MQLFLSIFLTRKDRLAQLTAIARSCIIVYICKSELHRLRNKKSRRHGRQKLHQKLQRMRAINRVIHAITCEKKTLSTTDTGLRFPLAFTYMIII